MKHNKNTYITVGKFGKTHGVRGEITLFSYTEEPEAVFAYAPYCPALQRTAELTRRGIKGGGFIVSVEGVNTREEAAKLTNATLTAPRDILPELSGEDDIFYYADLEGMRAIYENGAEAGTVKAVHNFGAGDILEIAAPDGGTFMTAFDNISVPDVNTQTRIVTLARTETISDKS